MKKMPKLTDNIQRIASTITAIGIIGGAIIGVTSWLSNRLTAKTEGRLDEIQASLIEIRRDTLRSQLLLLISNYPDNKQRILTVAKTYFQEMDGDWYVSELFNEWATEHDVDISGILSVKEMNKLKEN